MNENTQIVIVYAIVPKHDLHKMTVPEGTILSAVEVGALEDVLDKQFSRNLGAMVAGAIYRCAKKICPERLITNG